MKNTAFNVQEQELIEELVEEEKKKKSYTKPDLTKFIQPIPITAKLHKEKAVGRCDTCWF